MSLTNLTPKEREKLLVKYAPEDHVSPKAFVEVVKSQIMKGKGSFSELVYFLEVAKRAGLDPSQRQVYAVFRWDNRQGKEVMTIQTGIDGLRSVAERSGLYAGSDGAVFKAGGEKRPEMATITVYKLNKTTGERMPTTATARWSEYCPINPKTKNPEFMWKKMPYTMLEKCAEAKALRKAFPLTQGIYVAEEMQQANEKLPVPKKIESKEKVDAKSILDKVKKKK